MSEETEQTPDKQSELKEKLKQMGVMQDENAPPREKASLISRYKVPIILVILIAIVLFWWNGGGDDEQQEVAQAPQQSAPGTMDRPYVPGMPPPPPGYMPGHGMPGAGGTMPSTTSPDGEMQNQESLNDDGNAARPGWNRPGTRAGDRYGPPPGPPAPGYGYYGRPYGYGYYPPPPPPSFYGPYGPYRSYAPPPRYRPPWFTGNYPPPANNAAEN